MFVIFHIELIGSAAVTNRCAAHLHVCKGNSTRTNCPKCVDRNISGILSRSASRCVVLKVFIMLIMITDEPLTLTLHVNVDSTAKSF